MPEQMEMPEWEDLTTVQLPAVELFDMKKHELVFLSDKPRKGTDKWNKRIHIFAVSENKEKKTLLVSSVKLAYKLKQIQEKQGLLNKIITIQRQGEGTKIDYEVNVV